MNRRLQAVLFGLLMPFFLLSPRMRAKARNFVGRKREEAAEWLEQRKLAAIQWFNRLNGTPVPDGPLMHLVAGSDDIRWFIDSGKLAATSTRAILAKNGIDMRKLGAILDFGCGCGRVVRHWKRLRRTVVHGTDYNDRLVAWCRQNLRFAKFKTNGLVGQLDYDDDEFDLIYALSVFTHLTEQQQFFWLEELTRVLKPGGYLFITVHGSPFYLDRLNPDEFSAFFHGRLVVQGAEHEGSNVCTVYHPQAYVREQMARNLAVVDFVHEGALGNPRQDVYLLQKPIGRPSPLAERPQAEQTVSL